MSQEQAFTLFDLMKDLQAEPHSVLVLPLGRNMRAGRQVRLKGKYLDQWPTVATGKQLICNDQLQTIGEGFHCRLEVVGDRYLYELRFNFKNKNYNESGELNAIHKICGFCDGNKNNRAHLSGSSEKGKLVTYPHETDRIRIDLENNNGELLQVELDTTE